MYLLISIKARVLKLIALAGFSSLSLLANAAISPEIVHHEISTSIEPNSHKISVTDSIHIPASLAKPTLELLLNASLKPAITSPGLKIKQMQATQSQKDIASLANTYKIEGLKPNQAQVITLRYSGQINTPIATQGEEYARGFSESSGLIEDRGVYLAGSTLWTPYIKGSFVTYDLHTNLPAGWKSVSQGSRISSQQTKDKRALDHWQVTTPTEEVHLIAARFTEYSRDAGNIKAYAFLRKPDEALATRYLDATAQYMQLYQNIIGPYPYSKFALVENFWETGYGMPSFTLLGEQIIRFPFIVTSSYPHELLHNWWGNSVFVDETGGNWCEGLTAYMADHLLAEQRGQGVEHRRDILQRVTDYVTADNDFPPSQFLSRDSSATEAIGYGKTAMVWNMLREKIGDDLFLKSVQKFYRDNRFRKASFDDLRLSFEAVSGQNLQAFFAQWIQQTGAPELRLDKAERAENQLSLTLSQIQAGKRFILDVPIAIYTSKGVELKHIDLTGQASTTADFTLSAPALRVEIDPQFQVYRRLSPLETPPSLSKAFGASKVLIVTPSGQEGARYAGLTKAWTKEGVEVIEDKAITTLPSDRVVWILGTSNRFASSIADALKTNDVSLTSRQTQIGAGVYPTNTKSLVLTARHPANANSVIVYLSAPSEAAANGLARKLPHYGKYSWLVFGGDAPDNEAKGEWPITNTPLAKDLAEHGELQALPKRKALGELAPLWDTASLKSDIDWLAAPARQGRGIGSKGLDASALYIADRYRKLGLQPLNAAGNYFQPFSLKGENGKIVQAKNVIGIIPGSHPAFAGQSLVISAHYDHLGYGWPDVHAGDEGKLHPGADDNASGVALLLEFARLLASSKPERTIILLATSGEEAGLLGAHEYVKSAKLPNAAFPLNKVIANLNIDTIGRLENGKVTIFGANSAREWSFIFDGASAVTGIPTNIVTNDANASDHAAFIEAGIPAIQLFASTAGDYHRPSDTANKIDISGIIKAGTILKEAVDYLASRPEVLNGNAPTRTTTSSTVNGREPRRASTGIVPDMNYTGEGVRAASVIANSGADKAGLKAGDTLISIAGIKIPDLKALADALKTLDAGATVEVIFISGAETIKSKLILSLR